MIWFISIIVLILVVWTVYSFYAAVHDLPHLFTPRKTDRLLYLPVNIVISVIAFLASVLVYTIAFGFAIQWWVRQKISKDK